jgi:hypothetical protein
MREILSFPDSAEENEANMIVTAHSLVVKKGRDMKRISDCGAKPETLKTLEQLAARVPFCT